jgi:putative ABC transport system permease protein
MEILASALRALRAHKLFSALVIGLLALGIGANTAIFGVVHAVLLKPLPYPAPGELVLIRKPPRDGNTAAMPGGGTLIVDKDLSAWIEAQPKSFRALAGYSNATSTLQQTGGSGAIRVPTGRVTLGFFQMLGVSAWRGRLLQEEDFKSGATPVAVLSYSAWQSRFNGDDSALGTVVQLDEVAHTIVGVLPPAFEFIDPVQFWRPLPLGGLDRPGQLQISMIRAFGRLLPGTAHEVAQRELDGISERFWDNYSSSFSAGLSQPAGANAPAAAASAPADGNVTRVTQSGSPPAPAAASANEPRRLPMPFVGGPAQLTPLQEQLARQSRTTLWLLLGAVGFVLLIACANIANLQLARAASRRREAAVRAALGASPARLAGELLAENLLLALAGGALGLLFAWWGTQALQGWLADLLPRVNSIGVDFTVLGFALLAAIAAGLGFGLAPAWQTSRVDLLETLKEGGHQASAGGNRWRRGLVAFEVALALVLAVNTGLLVKSIYQLYSTDLGYRTEDVMTANLSLPRRYATPAQQRDFAQRWLEAIRILPGVKSAAIADTAPLSPFAQVFAASIRGGTGNANRSVDAPPPTMQIASVTPDYFATAGIALKSGRFFTAADGDSAPIVALVNEEFIKQNFPDGLREGATVVAPVPGQMRQAMIVGVVANVRARGLDSQPSALAYFPLAQVPRQRLSALVQFTGDSATLARALTQATHKIDADLALDTPSTLAQQIARQTAPRRVTLMLTGAFAVTAVSLAALGIFGVMSYTVTQRTQEIGVRMALGAEGATILRWILGYGGAAVAVGLVVGLALTFGTSKLLRSTLTGVTELDPTVTALGVAGLGLVGLAACLVPALRATRVNPVEALRNE